MTEKVISRGEQREKKRQRIQNYNTEEKKLVIIPAIDSNKLKTESDQLRVCAYCRVSTDDPAQTLSYELQKNYYEKEISNTTGWTFAGIYADEGISATSLKNRDAFNQMLEDCYEGKIDVILTKNVSRFARNVVDCLSIVRKLAQLNPPVGVKFENEGFYSLDAASELLLTVLAASAQEESKTKSNSMNWSLEKRFDNGDFLTPVLLGYDHDENGNLVVNEEEAVTIKLMYYSYLAGFPLSEVATLLNKLRRPSKLGNIKWTASSVRRILTNERYCGNVLSWKTYTYDFWEHKKRKNRHNRKQVLEIDHHEGIVTHEIYDAVQAKLEMNKYARKRSPYPTLDVVDTGILRGFVSVNRQCKGFTSDDYVGASESVYEKAEERSNKQQKNCFYLDRFEIVRSQFFSMTDKPIMTINNGRVSFNMNCLRKFDGIEYVELLINTVEKCMAIRPCDEDSPNAIRWCRIKDGKRIGSQRSISGFFHPLFTINGWDNENKYRLCGQYLSKGDDKVLLFDLSEPEITKLVQHDLDHSEEMILGDSNQTNVPDEKNDHENSSYHETKPMDKQVNVIGFKICYPNDWRDGFGKRVTESTPWYYERIHYQDDWDILRPASFYCAAGNINKTVIQQVEEETQKMIKEMRCAV